MPSLVDITKPATGQAFTADMRANFTTIAGEIEALQEAMESGSEQVSIGTEAASIIISAGAGVPGNSTPGHDKKGSLYSDVEGATDTVLYLSNGDSTWKVVA